jgi:hypothetical protein
LEWFSVVYIHNPTADETGSVWRTIFFIRKGKSKFAFDPCSKQRAT